jgi:hypothetical protein
LDIFEQITHCPGWVKGIWIVEFGPTPFVDMFATFVWRGGWKF